MTRVGETLADELKRLIGEYQDDDAGESTKAEAWNLIADFTVENSAVILRALSPCLDGAGARSPRDWYVWLRDQTDDSGNIPSDRLAHIARFLRASLARKNTGEVEPVAWRRMNKQMTQSTAVTDVKSFADQWAKAGDIVEPLFASPPLPDTEENRS
ncbi:hypothetical protein [Mesorhizobium sp. B2-5-11]|uniref:hypothetical protein n=1 Tax=Mesorhizobium sp. B2-5-11 TaxID=2589919 RepID=UPI0011276021|nr:hypothetical protein [Mesorhizobium sp. B2-5-11]TPK14120.1 hypothetical protein FJ490_02015 [Mesorhizobium sp. B2-5-11]